jgi:integrase
MPLFDEEGQRIRGQENKEAADLALARAKLTDDGDGVGEAILPREWVVAKVCSEYLQYCERGLANGTISKSHRDNAVSFLNDLCVYCGALPVAQLKKGHIKAWLESHTTWRSTATHRGVLAIVLAAFNYAEQMHEIPSPLKGLKKPASQPRLQSFSAEDEKAIYGATEERFGDFLFAAIHSGLRPFCELAQLKADDVEELDRGMMWRVYSSKTKKTRKIPVRPEVAERVRRLMKTAPRGSGLPLFRNTKGKPWKRMTGVVRFLALKKKLGWDQNPVRSKYSCYTCRHTFAHRMLSGYWNGGVGCSIETLAELIGDTPKVAFDHYGREWGQHYQDPLWAAIGAGARANGEARGGQAVLAGFGRPGTVKGSKRVRSVELQGKRSPPETKKPPARRERKPR